MPCVGDPGTRPAAGGASEHLGELAFGERIAGLRAEPVRGHRCDIIGIGSGNLVTILHPGKSGRRPGRLTRRPPALSGSIVVVLAVLLAVNGFG